MTVDDRQLQSVADDFGTPCFVYDLDEVRRRVETLNSSFENLFQVSYAMKCNPHSELLSLFKDSIPSLDVSSGGELHRAVAAGWDASRISFTGPAKQDWEHQAAVTAGVGKMIVESPGEAARLNDVAGQHDVIQPILIRVAPAKIPKGFGVNMSGKPCQFGVDEEDISPLLAEIKNHKNLKLIGFHVYSGTQCLDPDAIVENFQNLAELFETLCSQADIEPEALIFGSGFGVPYHDGMSTLDIDSVAKNSTPILRKLKSNPAMQSTSFLLELGRWLVGEAGTYLTSVVARKESRGKSIAICDGGMNHHLGACGHLGSVIHRNYQMKSLSESAANGAEKKGFSLVGPLCTSIDSLGQNVQFSQLNVGDVVAISCSGAYGFSASPLNFISHDLPREVFVSSDESGALQGRLASPEFTPGQLAWTEK